MGWAVGALLALGILAAVIAWLAWLSYRADREKLQRQSWAATSEAERAHELALADREVEMWTASLGTRPTTFAEHLGGRRMPTLVGRSQVLAPPAVEPAGDHRLVQARMVPPSGQCLRPDQHAAHAWVLEGEGEGPQPTTRLWCDGLNADGTAPYDPGRPGWDADIAREEARHD